MIDNYGDFWDFYLREHRKPATRALHYIGTSLGMALLAWFIWLGTWHYIPLCLVSGYGFAWVAHFFIEKNKPASFKYPFWSFVSDYKMLFYFLTGRMGREARRVSESSSFYFFANVPERVAPAPW